MRAVTKLNQTFYANGALNESEDAINFFAMAGIFDPSIEGGAVASNSLAAIYPY